MKISPSPLVISAPEWLLLIALSILWGGSFYFAKVAVLEIPPLTLALARVLIAGAVIGILIRPLGGAFPRDLATWKMFAVVAALNNAIPFTLIVWGQQYIPIGLASILNATSPLFSVVLAHFATRDDRLTLSRALGLIAGFIGVVVLIGPDLLTELGKHVWAQLALLAAALFYAIGAIYARRLRGHKPVVIAGGQLAMATVLLLPFALAIDRPWTLAPVSGRLHGAGVPDLLPHPQPRRRDQRAAGDVPHSGQRDPARAFPARRAARRAAVRRNAGDRHRPRRHRRSSGAIPVTKVPPRGFVNDPPARRVDSQPLCSYT